MLRQLSSRVALHPWVKQAAMSTPGVRDLAWRFVAGEDLEQGLAAARALARRGVRATLNYVGTHARSEEDAVAAADAAVACLGRLRDAGLDANVSVKLTNLGLDLSEPLCRALLERVLAAAGATGGFVRIDMEESRYVERTHRIFEDARAAHGDGAVGIVHQSYLRHRAGELDRLLAEGARVRLVKGGYWEPAEVVHRQRADVDAAFLRDVARAIEVGRRPAIATHDPAAIALARRAAAARALPPGALELQMLYGVRAGLQAALAREGYVVRAYVPYGSRWYEYVLGCVRRAPTGALRRLGDRLRGRRADAAAPLAAPAVTRGLP